MSQEFATLLRRRRLQNRISQTDLANKAGISRRTLNYWESGEKLPRTVELESVLNALRIAPQEKIQFHTLLPTPRSQQFIQAQETDFPHLSPILMAHPGDLLRAMRVRQGKTQIQLAAEAGVTRKTLMSWEALNSFPSDDNLDRICTLLNASSEERRSLASHRLTDLDERDYADVETCRAQLHELSEMIRNHSPLVDLSALALQRKLTLMAMSEPEALYLLACTQLLLGHIQLLKSHSSAAKKAANQALTLFTQTGRSDANWALALNLVSLFEGKGRNDSLAKVIFLHRHLSAAVDPAMKLRMYCDMALYLSQAQKGDEARRMIFYAQRELHCAPETQENHHYFALSYGRVLLNTGVPAAAMQQFTNITAYDPYNAGYLCYLAEAALGMGEKETGAHFLQQATDILARSPFSLVQEQVRLIARRL